MKKNIVTDPIDRYVKEVIDFLPYQNEKKGLVSNELKKDVQDAMKNDKRPPSVVFGTPKEVAINLSISQDWGTTKASWFHRLLAFIIDIAILTLILLIFVVIPLSLSIVKPTDSVERFYFFLGINFFIGIPVIGFLLSYFIILEKMFSTTIGKKVFGLKVLHESGIKINWQQGLIRNITKIPFVGQFLIFDVLIGMFSEKTNAKNQRVLDLVAGTIVVKQN